jgi:hypothetical protein
MTIKFENEMIYDDGGYSVQVLSGGYRFSIHYVNSELRTYGVGMNGRDVKWRRSVSSKNAEKAVAERIKALGPEFQAKHEWIYSDEYGAR